MDGHLEDTGVEDRVQRGAVQSYWAVCFGQNIWLLDPKLHYVKHPKFLRGPANPHNGSTYAGEGLDG